MLQHIMYRACLDTSYMVGNHDKSQNHGRLEQLRLDFAIVHRDFGLTLFSTVYLNMHVEECYLTPTTTLKSSSKDLLIYFWKLNLLPGERWTYT